MEKLKYYVEKALKENKLQTDNMDTVILAGGSSKIPAVKKLISKLFPGQGKVKFGVNPDEAITIGAAIFADTLKNKQGAALKDVTAFPIGMNGLDCFTDDKTSEQLGCKEARQCNYFQRFTNIPAKLTKPWRLIPRGAKENNITVLEGIYDCIENNTEIGRYFFSCTELDKDGYCSFDVTFELDENAILTVTAIGHEGSKVSQSFKPNTIAQAMDDDEIIKLKWSTDQFVLSSCRKD